MLELFADTVLQNFVTLQMLQVAEYHARSVVSVNPVKRPSLKARKQKLLSFLQGTST